jgi:DNA polymerase-4
MRLYFPLSLPSLRTPGAIVRMIAFCRDCLSEVAAGRAECQSCHGRRIVAHPELDKLAIAHLDCDAFYAAVETRDNPALGEKPLIVGGGRRGVVLTASYPARKFGVKSAMPMFEALKLCPQAIVVRPNMSKYAAVAREIRLLLLSVTPQVEPLSLDEAYLDLTGTASLHGMAPAKTMARLVNQIERAIGITVSVGLSYNKFLAKLASDLDKPRGYAVIGIAEAKSFLCDKPIGIIRGVGPVLQARLCRDGISVIGQLQKADVRNLTIRYGATGSWLYRLALGEDNRLVGRDGQTKSVSSETTFEHNISSLVELERVLWDQAERVSARAKEDNIGGRTITLKLKTAAFRIKTRSLSLDSPTQLSDIIFRAGRALLARECGPSYRLLGVGLSQICPAAECDPPRLLDESTARRAAVERAVDSVRAKFGKAAVLKGRSMGARSM